MKGEGIKFVRDPFTFNKEILNTWLLTFFLMHQQAEAVQTPDYIITSSHCWPFRHHLWVHLFCQSTTEKDEQRVVNRKKVEL